MKYISEFRDRRLVEALAEKIRAAAKDVQCTFMEVCGTHTMAIARFGIKELLPNTIRLLSGPGCPVCVTPNSYLDHAIALSRLPKVIVATFGDMMRVPASSSSLEKEKASGRDIRIVYSPLDTIELAEKNPDKEIIFLSVGFETTVPTIASTLMMARDRSITNLSVLTANKVVPPALEALLAGKRGLDGFILPGHVSTIIGAKAYEKIIGRIACSIAGFEPTDIMEAILNLTEHKLSGTPQLSIKYRRSVTYDGNLKAQSIMAEAFEPTDSCWRGIGTISGSGLAFKAAFERFDAAKRFDVAVEETREESGCICGSILQGLGNPDDCPLFRKRCTPENPVGACMVSGEGTCAAWYKYS